MSKRVRASTLPLRKHSLIYLAGHWHTPTFWFIYYLSYCHRHDDPALDSMAPITSGPRSTFSSDDQKNIEKNCEFLLTVFFDINGARHPDNTSTSYSPKRLMAEKAQEIAEGVPDAIFNQYIQPQNNLHPKYGKALLQFCLGIGLTLLSYCEISRAARVTDGEPTSRHEWSHVWPVSSCLQADQVVKIADV